MLATLEKRGTREHQRAALEQVTDVDGAERATPERRTAVDTVRASPQPYSSPISVRLDAVEADELTPRDALALVQELKALRKHEQG